MHMEGMALVTLSLMLVAVFMASVFLYDDLASESADGTLAAFASAVRTFLDENEAVSVFLGLQDAEPIVEAEPEAISAAAKAYIEQYNRIYEALE